MSDFEDYNAEEPATDGDDFTDPIATFPSLYHKQSSVAMGLNKSSVLQLAQCGDSVCALSDTGTVCVYSTDTLTKTNTLQPHTAPVTGLATTHTLPHMVATCSTDHTVKVWDIRVASDKPSHTLTFSGSVASQQPHCAGKPLNSVAMNSSGLVAAGTEQVGGETFLLFWDTRQGNKLLGGYWDSHNDDITSLQFHRDKKDILATGSTDGLVNVLDLSQGSEDDALVTSHNTEDSVGRVLWYSRKGDPMQLAIQTHTEEIQLWNTDDVGPHTVFDRSSICHGIRRKISEHTYIAGIHASQEQGGLVVIAGSSCSSGPCLRLARIKNKKVKPLSMLGGEGSVVRCSLALEAGGYVTGGEDGIVAVWREGEGKNESEQKGGKISKRSKKSREKPY